MSAYELARLFVCFKPTIDGRAVTGAGDGESCRKIFGEVLTPWRGEASVVPNNLIYTSQKRIGSWKPRRTGTAQPPTTMWR